MTDPVAGVLQTKGDRKAGEEAIRKIAAELHRRGVTPEQVGQVRRISMWQTATKDKEGEAHLHDLYGFQLAPSWDDGPEWPVVQPAAPVRVPAVKPKTRPADRRTVIFPDPQIGYRRLAGGEMIPMQDAAAMDAALQVAKAAGCERAVNLGDTLDLPEWSSKFLVLPEFVNTTQDALDDAHRFLAQQRSFMDDVFLFEGNHDNRLGNAIARNAMAALRLRPAATPPEHWPVLSIPALLRLDDLEVTYVDGYPAGRLPLTDGNDSIAPLLAIHGQKLDIVKVAKAERQSFVQGHVHRQGMHCETYEFRGCPVTVMAFTPGCLCRTDGVVPSTNGGADSRGRPVKRWENWQQGLAIVNEYDDGGWFPELVPIHKGRAMWRGRTYDAA